MKTRTYDELCHILSFRDRLDYLSLYGEYYDIPSREIINNFYKSSKWLYIRREVILRDMCSDLGILGVNITGKVYVHHINPVTEEDIIQNSYKLYDMNNLITCSLKTHNIIHYGEKDEFILRERYPGDTILW